MRRLIVLRPEPGASETVARARACGLDAVAVPLFEIEAVVWEPPDTGDFDALLLTSANAVRHGGAGLEQLKGLPVHAVGEATAEAARRSGFEVVTVGRGDIDDLLASLPPALKLLHLCGEHRRAPRDALQVISPCIVYRSAETAPPADLAVVQNAAVLVHSPRAASRLREIVDRAEFDLAAVAVAAISAAAAREVGTRWETVEVAAEPTDEALLALAARLCNKPATK
jgi:uroporphyrinogen-III synthase